MRALCLLLFLSAAARASEVLWVTTDFSSGGLALQGEGACTASELSLTVPGDAMVRFDEGYVYVLGRLGYDNVTVLSAAEPDSVIIQFSTGNGTNPQDIMPVSEDRAYVTLFERPEILVVDPRSGAHLGTIDLSVAADPDGIPEMTRLFRHGEAVLVVCQRLDRSTPSMEPAGPGCVVVLDALSGELIDTNPSTTGIDPFWLPRANPTSACCRDDHVFLTCTGSWNAYDDGAVVWLDLATGSTGIVASEETLGGNVSGLAIQGQRGFVVTSDASWANRVVPLDLVDGTVGQPLQGLSSGYIPDILAYGGLVYVADQGTWSQPELAGVVLVDAQSLDVVCGPVATGLPPMSGAIITPFDAPPVPLLAPLLEIWPNPASSVVYVGVPEGGAPVVVSLLDLAGHRVAGPYPVRGVVRLVPGALTPRITPGTYLVHATRSGVRESRTLVIR